MNADLAVPAALFAVCAISVIVNIYLLVELSRQELRVRRNFTDELYRSMDELQTRREKNKHAIRK